MTSIDSAGASVLAAQQSAISSKIATTVAAKQLQAAEQQGQAAVKLIESAAQLANANGSGHHIDAHA